MAIIYKTYGKVASGIHAVTRLYNFKIIMQNKPRYYNFKVAEIKQTGKLINEVGECRKLIIKSVSVCSRKILSVLLTSKLSLHKWHRFQANFIMNQDIFYSLILIKFVEQILPRTGRPLRKTQLSLMSEIKSTVQLNYSTS